MAAITHEERLARVHRALVEAEVSVGLRRTRSALPSVPGGGGVDQEWLEVPEAWHPVLPHGAVRRGSSVSVTGSTALELHLLAALAGEGAWTALVAHPDLGLAAAVDAGLDPARLLLVPDPGPGAAAVLAAAVDGFDVVAVGPLRSLDERDRRALSQRVRHRGAVLVSTEPWPGAELRLSAGVWRWDGLVSSGRVTGGSVVVRQAGTGRPRTAEVGVEEHDGGTRLVPLPRQRPARVGRPVRVVEALGAGELAGVGGSRRVG